MRKIIFILIILIIGCAKEEIKEFENIEIHCNNLDIGHRLEWEARGFIVEGNIARGFGAEYDITKQKICKDNDASQRCNARCLNEGGMVVGVEVSDKIVCGCRYE